MLQPEERELFLRQGYLVVPDFLAQDALDCLKVECERLLELNRSNDSNVFETVKPLVLEQHPAARTDLAAFDAIRTIWPLTRNVRDVLLGERMRTLVQGLLGAKDVVLFNEQYIIKPSRSGTKGAFGWHRDSDSLLKATGRNSVPYLSVWVAIDDMTGANGCLVVRPVGATARDEVTLEVSAGTAVVMSSMLEHCSGPNITKFARRAWMPQFALYPILIPGTDVPVGLSIHVA